MATSKILYVREGLSPTVWDAFLSDSNDALLFHRSDWLEILKDTQNASLKRYGFYADAYENKLVSVMPLLIRRFGPFRVAGSPLVVEDTPYMGPAVPEELLSETLIALRNEIKHEVSFLRTLIPYAASSASCKVLAENGFSVTTKVTHRLDLSLGASTIWDQMEGRCRTAIRRAKKAGVTIRFVDDPGVDEVTNYYRLTEGVYGSQGRDTPNSLEFYHRLWKAFRPSGHLSLILAEIDGKQIAGALCGHDARRVYYLDGASDRAHRRLNASNLVLWSAMEWAIASGRGEFDFVGSDIPRLAQFKASFGGRLVEHSCIEWARSKALWRIREWYGQRGRGIIARLRHKWR